VGHDPAATIALNALALGLVNAQDWITNKAPLKQKAMLA